MTRLLLLGNDLGNGSQNLDGQEANAILIVLGKMLEHRYHLFNNDRCGHLLHELGEVGGSLAADHRCLIVNELSELLAEL